MFGDAIYIDAGVIFNTNKSSYVIKILFLQHVDFLFNALRVDYSQIKKKIPQFIAILIVFLAFKF